MLDTVPNEDRVATYLLDMLLHFSDCWGVLEPLLADAMNAIETVRDGDFRVDKRVDQDATALIHDANLAHGGGIVALVHLTVQGNE